MANIHQKSTKKIYHNVWKNFNKFVIKLDWQPDTWEEKVSLYCTFLSFNDVQSSTMKSYISGIKAKLRMDGYRWDNELFSFSSLTRACKLKNDLVKVRLPVRVNLLELTLYEIYRKFDVNDYFNMYYQSMFLSALSVSYYGLFRIGEITNSQHVMKAKDIHFSEDKQKLQIVLHSSKTHGKGDRPQKICIESIKGENSIFCPVKQTHRFTKLRKTYDTDDEPFYVHRDGTPLKATEFRTILRSTISKIGLEAYLYDTHSLRIGRVTDLFKQGMSVERIKKLGRWRSNAIYKYLRD